MNPLKAIEAWISEHGSAASLRDHLALVKEQMADLKSKKEASDLRAGQAEAKAEKLQAQLDDARKEIEILKQPRPAAVQVIKRRSKFDALLGL